MEHTIMNIRLTSDPRDELRYFTSPRWCCSQTRQMQRERLFDSSNGNSFLIPVSVRNDRYRRVTLPEKVVAFFLSGCYEERVIPLQSNDRIYVVDDEAGFPPGLAECTIELRKKNIWVVQKVLRAIRHVRGFPITGERAECDCCEKSLPVGLHQVRDNYIRPNTREEIKETFQANASLSPLCNLMTSFPELIHRCVCEGIYYAGRPKRQAPDTMEYEFEGSELLKCAYCHAEGGKTSKELESLSNSPHQYRRAVKERLEWGIIHANECRFREFLNDSALLTVSDLAGNVILTQMYYIADPALETTGNSGDTGKSCPYTQVFVMSDISEQERGQLVISHDQINKLIHQQRLENLCTRTREDTGVVTAVLQNYEQMIQELAPKYQRFYDDSELKRAVSSYRSKLLRLPRPATRLQQDVLDFIADADTKLRALYVASKQLTNLLPSTGCASAGLQAILTPKISELVAQYRQAMQAVHEQIPDVTNLTTLVPYELWDNSALREICEAGNELLDYLTRLNIDNNELYQVFIAHSQDGH